MTLKPPDQWPPTPYQALTEIRQDPRVFCVTSRIDDELLLCRGDRDRILGHTMQNAQWQLGRALVDFIMQAGGKAIVDIRTGIMDDHWPPGTLFKVAGEVQPAHILAREITILEDHVVQRKMVTHWEYFPMDWVCDYCGRIVDGLKFPRGCPHCAGIRKPPVGR